MTRQTMQKASLYFGVLLAGIILCGCYTVYERPHHLSLYNKFYRPNISADKVAALLSSGDYPTEIIVKSGLSIAQMQAFNNALINFYGCIYIGESAFIGQDDFHRYKVSTHTDAYGFSTDEYEIFRTDDVKDPERLALQIGANYYITYSQYTNPSTTTATDVNTKVATQGGMGSSMGRGTSSGTTTTTTQDAQLTRGAIFYLCD